MIGGDGDGRPDSVSAAVLAADAVGRRAVVKLAALPFVLVAALSLAAVSSMAAVAWAAVIEVAHLRGDTLWWAIAYAEVLSVAGLARLVWSRIGWSGLVGRASRRRGRRSAATVTETTSWLAWLWRVVVAAPVAVLGGLGLHRWGLPIVVAVAVAMTAWASVDITDLASRRSRRRVRQLLQWTRPRGSGLARVPQAAQSMAQDDRALIQRMVAARFFLDQVINGPMVARDGQISAAVFRGAGGLLAMLAEDLLRRADVLDRQGRS
jgi:hypothetical protein